MILTYIHFEYWTYSKMPDWAKSIRNIQRPRPSIDACINAHAGQNPTRSDSERVMRNLLWILRMRRSRAVSLRDSLLALAVSPGTTDHSKKRAAIARRWYIRIAAPRYMPVI